jgi:geranylgeranyl diphosphate synthase type II
MTTREGAERVRRVLDEYGELTRARLDEYLRTWSRDPHLAALVRDYPSRGGRMLRSSLCLAAASVFGARPTDALDSAVSLELLHNAFLVHDDIEDESEERRGRPTLHVLHGVPSALNAGDALGVLGWQPLVANQRTLGPRLALRVLEEAQEMARISVEGQARELAWRTQNRLDLCDADYLRLVLEKTCWYTTIYPLRVGALIGSRDGVALERFVPFGFFVGATFQIQDDLLNLIGDPVRYGKELCGDIREGKRTLMMVHLYRQADPEERARLLAMLVAPRRGPAEVRWIRERMDFHGCIDHARKTANALAGAALHEFQGAFAGLPASRDLDFIEGLATWMINRS